MALHPEEFCSRKKVLIRNITWCANRAVVRRRADSSRVRAPLPTANSRSLTRGQRCASLSEFLYHTDADFYKVLPQSKPCAAGPQPFSDGAPHPLSPSCLQPKDKLLNLVELVNDSQETLIGTQSSSSASREPLQRHLLSRCSSLKIL